MLGQTSRILPDKIYAFASLLAFKQRVSLETDNKPLQVDEEIGQSPYIVCWMARIIETLKLIIRVKEVSILYD